MKFVVRAKIPVETGNRMVKDPRFLPNLEKYISQNKVESAYFYESEGMRTFAFVIEMKSADMLPSIAEPLFQQYHAKVECHPAMTLADLKRAIKKIK